MVIYEVRRGVTKYFRPSFRVKANLNPILRSARTVRIIKKNITRNIKPKLSLIPKTIKTRSRRIKVI